MRVLGAGLIASALNHIADGYDDAVAFATGVSDSSSTDAVQYRRERSMLRETIEQARASGERLIYFSSGGAVYGRWAGPANEQAAAQPRTAYGRHKVACEEAIVSSGVRHVILRLPNVVGDAGNVKQLIPSLVAQVLTGHVHVYTRAARDLLDAEDMARTLAAVLDATPESAIVNVATGRSITAEQIAREICRILELTPDLELIDAGHPQLFDITKLRQILGRDPFPVDDYARSVLERHVPRLATRMQRGHVGTQT